jgi:TatD DNase family protein
MKNYVVDTHSHVYLPEFDDDREAVYERAAAEKVEKILLPAIDSSTHEQMLRTEQGAGGGLIAMMGLHPCSVKGNFKEELREARNHFDHRKFIAVGEIGLDFYWDKTYTKEQYNAFHEQVEWALHYDIPIVIHSRESIDECIEVVRGHQKGKLRGVFHCFSGNEKQANEIVKLGFYVSIGGVVTFRNAGLDKVMENFSLDRVVLETDAPYLAPVPFRGKRNEPSYLKYVIEKLAVLKGMEKEEVSEITSTNAQELFKLEGFV